MPPPTGRGHNRHRRRQRPPYAIFTEVGHCTMGQISYRLRYANKSTTNPQRIRNRSTTLQLVQIVVQQIAQVEFEHYYTLANTASGIRTALCRRWSDEPRRYSSCCVKPFLYERLHMLDISLKRGKNVGLNPGRDDFLSRAPPYRDKYTVLEFGSARMNSGRSA